MILSVAVSAVSLVAYVVLAVLVLRHDWRRLAPRLFVLYLASMIYCGFSALMVSLSADSRSAGFWYRLMLTGGVFSAFYFHFTQAKLHIRTVRQTGLRVLGYAAGLLLAVLILARPQYAFVSVYQDATRMYIPALGPLVYLYGLYVSAYLGLGLANLVRHYRTTRSEILRNRLRYLILGVSVMIISTLAGFSPAMRDYPLAILGNLVNALLIAYAILRYQLLDITLIFRRGLAYGIAVTGIGAAYLATFLTLEVLLHTWGRGALLIVFAGAVAVALAFPPVRDRAQSAIDRLFFREEYDSRRMLRELSQTAVSVLDLEALATTIVDTVATTMRIGRLALLVRDTGAPHFRVAAQWGLAPESAHVTLQPDHPLAQHLSATARFATWHDLAPLPSFKALRMQEREELGGLEAELFVPIMAKGKLVGIFAAGPRLLGGYSPDDLITLATLADQTAVALENARLYAAARRDLADRVRAEAALQKAHAELELRVAERTAELNATNAALRVQVAERERAEAALQAAQAELESRIADRTRQLTTLYGVTALASASLNLQVILEQSLDRVLETLACPAGAVHLLAEGDGDVLRLAVERGLPPALATRLQALPARADPAGWMLEHGEPVVIADLAANPPLAWPATQPGFGVYAGAPMRVRGRVLGVLSLFGAADQRYSLENIALLVSVADHLGAAVENARLRRQAEQAAALQERERLAQELHDSVTQSIFSLTLFAHTAQELLRRGEVTRIGRPLDEIAAIAHQALKDMRLLLYELRPSALKREGLIGALRNRLDAVEGRAGVEARLLADPLVDLPPTAEEGLYRIAREALNNALKHARAKSVAVHIRLERANGNQVILEVVDDGVGFDPGRAGELAGMGLSGMRAQAEQLGADLEINSAPEAGTTVKVAVPVGPAPREQAIVPSGVSQSAEEGIR